MGLPREAVILVVDDEPAIRRLLAKLLRGVGTVRTAASADKGLQILENEPVDLVLSDMMMPDMTGAQLLAQVARRWPDTERVLMSGHCDLTPVMIGLRNGEIGYFLHKPWETAELLKEMRVRAGQAYTKRMG
jgi:DNA-binding NtrC family response regulator